MMTSMLLLLAMLLSPAPEPVQMADNSFQQALVLDMAKVLLNNYCYPENLLGMQEAIQQAIRSGEILQISDRKTLAGMLSSGVRGALNDPRLMVTYEPGYIPILTPALGLLSREQMVRLARSSTKVEMSDSSGIGYLRIDRIISIDMYVKLGQFLQDNIWTKAARAKALILDLRYSVGGEISGVPYLVSFFCDPDSLMLIETIYDRPSNTTRELWTLPKIPSQRYGKHKDLMVLISKRTNGAAEAVVYALKHLNRAIIVGERTSGGSVKVEKIRIDNSGFYISVPVARSTNPLTGQSWEVSGVTPSVSVRPKEAISKAKALIATRQVISKALQNISNLIERYYASRDKTKLLLSYLEVTDFFTVISEEELVAKLNYEIQQECEDPRLTIKTTKETHFSAEQTEDMTVETNLDMLIESYFKVQIRAGNIGYLWIGRFPDAATLLNLEKQMVQRVWEPLKDSKSLIIDLRSNSGGYTEGLPIILSYLYDTDQPQHFFTLYNSVLNSTTKFMSLPAIQGPSYGSERNIYALTGYHTAAAGEEFAYLMQSLRRGTVIGEITSGNLLHSQSFQIAETNIVLTVPVVNFVDNNGECWLGGGVVPDAIVLADEAENTANDIWNFQQDMQALVEGTAYLLKAHYALPDVAVRVQGMLQARWLEGSYRSVVDYESLASQLSSDLQESSGDHRLHVFYCDVELDAAQEMSPQLLSTKDAASFMIDSLFKVDLLPGNVGYLRADTIPDLEVLRAIGEQLVQQVWTKLVGTRALVIDMRYNTGGYVSAIPLLCSYFFPAEPPLHLYNVLNHSATSPYATHSSKVMTVPWVMAERYNPAKAVYILISHVTGSAAETLVQTLQDLGRATVVGEPTVGGSFSSGMYQIGRSILYASIPNQMVQSAVTGKLWSLTGVEPDIAVQASEALHIAKKIIATGTKVKDNKV